MDKNEFWSIDKLIPRVSVSHTFATESKNQNAPIRNLALDDVQTDFERPVYPNNSRVVSSYQLSCSAPFSSPLLPILKNIPAVPCSFVPCNTFSPSYLSLNEAQRAYFHYFCQCADEGKTVQTSFAYLQLYLCLKMARCQYKTALPKEVFAVWHRYRTSFPLLDRLFCDTLCDYSYLTGLPLPFEEIGSVFTEPDFQIRPFLMDLYFFDYLFTEEHTLSAKEMNLVLRMMTDIGFRKSKAYRSHPIFSSVLEDAVHKALKMGLFNRKDLNRSLFSIQIPSRLRAERRLFPGLPNEETPNRKISITYLPLIHDENIRDRFAETIRYLEHRVRKILKIKNSLSRIHISEEHRFFLEGILLEYEHLGAAEAPGEPQRSLEKPYQKRKLDINFSEASKIQEDSWAVTEKLTEQYTETTGDTVIIGAQSEEDDQFDQTYQNEFEKLEKLSACGDDEFWELAGRLSESEDQFMKIAVNLGPNKARQYCLANGMFFEAVFAAVNSKAQDTIGDCVFDNAGAIYDDYRENLQSVFPPPKGE